MENAYVLQLLEPKFKDFYLGFCGYSDCEPFHNYGPAARTNYIIHYILKGKGTYQVGERKYCLSEGQGFLVEPEVLTFYQADGEEPWSYIWIGFGGMEAEKYIRDIGLNKDQLIFQCKYGEKLKEIVLSILKHNHSSAADMYWLQGRLYDFFSILVQEDAKADSEDITKVNRYLMEAVTFIKNYYSRGIGVTDIAEHLNLDRSYLYKLFMEGFGISPKEFLTRFQVSRGKEQLTLTDFPVEVIAAACGYKNAVTFSKAFKQVIGMTPTNYRKRNRAEAKEKLSASAEELRELGDTGKKFIRY